MIPDPDAARAYCDPGIEIRCTANRLIHDPPEATNFNKARYKWVKMKFGPTHVVADGSEDGEDRWGNLLELREVVDAERGLG